MIPRPLLKSLASPSSFASFAPIASISAAFAGVVALALVAQGCAGCSQHAVCSLSGPINDPSNRTLRRSLMSFGLDEFCKQMIGRNVPLKLSDDAPAMGRFYPKGCRQRSLENGDLYVEFEGVGYAWSPLTKKVMFTAGAVVTYNQDFQCDDDDNMYAYFPPRTPVLPPQFKITGIENPLTSMLQSAMSAQTDAIGRGILRGKLVEGFTVIREPKGETDFGLGMIAKGQRPAHPYKTSGGEKFTYENLRTEVHRGEHDFIGPIVVEGSGKALYVSAEIDGARAVGILVMSADEAEPLLNAYIAYGAPNNIAPQRGEPFTTVAQSGQPYQRTLTVPPGSYYVVIDNNPQINPPLNPLDDRAAAVKYLIQIGDAP